MHEPRPAEYRSIRPILGDQDAGGGPPDRGFDLDGGANEAGLRHLRRLPDHRGVWNMNTEHDPDHLQQGCEWLRSFGDEAVLRRASSGARHFVLQGGLLTWFLDAPSVKRTFALMDKYRDHPMDMADGSLVTAAESLQTREIFTLERRDFLSYRVRIGRRHERSDS